MCSVIKVLLPRKNWIILFRAVASHESQKIIVYAPIRGLGPNPGRYISPRSTRCTIGRFCRVENSHTNRSRPSLEARNSLLNWMLLKDIGMFPSAMIWWQYTRFQNNISVDGRIRIRIRERQCCITWQWNWLLHEILEWFVSINVVAYGLLW